jgi:AcrR family transcriptional regulator
MAANVTGGHDGTGRSAETRPRPQPVGRGDHARRRVMTAALDQLADHGSAGFTMEAIARRAGASKATLYRHWPSASALLVDAMGAAFQPFSPPVTGDLGCDLTTLLTHLSAQLEGPRFPRLMAAIIDLAERDTDLAHLHADLTAAHRRPGIDILRAGQQRGRIPPDADLELLLDQLTAPFFYRRLIAHRPIPASMAQAVVDQTLALP